jgi:hypothetical protein
MKNQTSPTRWQLAWVDTSGQSHCVTLDNEPVGRITARPVVEPAPNLTERLNLLADVYTTKLNEAMRGERRNIARVASYHQHRLAVGLQDATERLHNAEYLVWMVWFARMRYEDMAISPYNNRERDRLTTIQYNGRAPF